MANFERVFFSKKMGMRSPKSENNTKKKTNVKKNILPAKSSHDLEKRKNIPPKFGFFFSPPKACLRLLSDVGFGVSQGYA